MRLSSAPFSHGHAFSALNVSHNAMQKVVYERRSLSEQQIPSPFGVTQEKLDITLITGF